MSPSGQKLFRAGIILVGVLFAGAMIVVPYWGRKLMRPAHDRDYESAPVTETTAPVRMIVPVRGEQVIGRYYPERVSVELEGRYYEAKAVINLSGLRVGSPAKVTYRRGASGKIYVDSVRPLTP